VAADKFAADDPLPPTAETKESKSNTLVRKHTYKSNTLVRKQ
jgi:hypothetical protein